MSLASTQSAIFQVLTTAGIAGGRIFDIPPADAAFPHVQIGDTQFAPADAQGLEGGIEYHDLHVWSRARGYTETKQIMQAIRAATHDVPLTIAGTECVGVFVESERVMRDPDGLTIHGIITLRIIRYTRKD